MIEARELMINNWVRHKPVWSYRQEDDFKEFDFQWSGTDWYQEGECCISFEDIEPIPITEEWLLNFGFEKLPYSFSLDRIRITKEDNSDIWWTAFNKNSAHINKIKHIHQLQNLYYALTGQELSLKPTITNNII